MDSFNLDDDIWSQMISSDPGLDQAIQLQDQIMIQDSILDVSNNIGEKQPSDVNGNSSINKKKMHREIEKQRREKMATLCSSLRSLLPLEFIKGTRSVGDHVNEATKYIKHLENEIKDLGAKRDQQNFLSSSNTTSSSHGNGSTNCSANYVTVSCKSVGQVEVMFSTTGFDQRGLQLSSVLKLLLQEGLSVVSCVSTKVNERLLHTIQSQVNNATCFNLSALQQQMNNLSVSAPETNVV